MQKLLNEWRKYLKESVPPPVPEQPVHAVCQDEKNELLIPEAHEAAAKLNYSCGLALIRYVEKTFLVERYFTMYDIKDLKMQWLMYKKPTKQGKPPKFIGPVPKCDSGGAYKEYCIQ